ncbi:hypothetical protein niasHT_017869 [Heterodera trifolii]|uniref:serine--tRNA ligase n=1 Tax=Heterodera trifolii TaxID=157864 RepID=A0ABD2LHS5_9BILA
MTMNHQRFAAFSRFGRRFLCSAAEQKQTAPNSPCTRKLVVPPPPDRPELDFDFLLDDANAAFIERNIRHRKGIGDVQRVRSLWALLQRFFPPFVPSGDDADNGTQNAKNENGATTASTASTAAGELRQLWHQFYAEAARLPNITSPGAPIGDASAARCVAEFGPSVAVGPTDGTVYPAEEVVSKWHSLRFPRAGSGGRSYAFIGSLSNIERALLDYSLDFLYERLQHDEQGVASVELVDVDDILPLSTTRACGVQQGGYAIPPSSMQYRVFRADQLRFDDPPSSTPANFCDPNLPGPVSDDDDVDLPQQTLATTANNHPNSYDDNFCLSGTAEMGIAHRLRGRVFEEHELPAYFMAQSRCFRLEAPSNQQDTGLYRVHEFNKIELFAVCTERQSDAELDRIVRLQQSLYASLQLRFRVMDMPSEELGAPAARKFDLEAWMPGRKSWGELCSASNCTDFQARRLHLKYRPSAAGAVNANGSAPLRFVHTCNGTGLASTRAMIALLETHQTGRQKGVKLPDVISERMPIERSVGIHCTHQRNAGRLTSFD